MYLIAANGNQYEGGWKDGKKHGPGKYFYLDKGQQLEGIWVADIPKCGVLVDFGRDNAPAPTQYPLPEVIAWKFWCLHSSVLRSALQVAFHSPRDFPHGVCAQSFGQQCPKWPHRD